VDRLWAEYNPGLRTIATYRWPADIERVIADFAREPDGGLILPPDGMTAKHRQLIITLAAKNHLPAIYNSRSYVDAGARSTEAVVDAPLQDDQKETDENASTVARGSRASRRGKRAYPSDASELQFSQRHGSWN
jgi:hypothetical protein